MPRKPRVEDAGYHHIINRGVARSKIFLKDKDYEKFLEILEKTKEIYSFNIHSFCLMNNHYHLLIEIQHNNLSLIARQINSKYAQYFNKEYKNKRERNQKILIAFKDGYTQSDIARYLNLTNAGVSYVIKNF